MDDIALLAWNSFGCLGLPFLPLTGGAEAIKDWSPAEALAVETDVAAASGRATEDAAAESGAAAEDEDATAEDADAAAGTGAAAEDEDAPAFLGSPFNTPALHIDS